MNSEVHSFFAQREEDPTRFVRRRPYKKNDNAHVEQKNFTHVRNLFGYERIADEYMVQLMNDIYTLHS